MLNRKERAEIFKAINTVSKKVNELSQKQDEILQKLNALTNERIDASGAAIDEMANMIATHNKAIDNLAEMITESEVQ